MWKVEINEVELAMKLMNSDKMREVIERVADERMWEMERESDKKLMKEVEMMNNDHRLGLVQQRVTDFSDGRDPLSPIYEKALIEMGKETDR